MFFSLTPPSVLGQNLRATDPQILSHFNTFWSVAHVDPYLIIGDGSCLLA